MPQPDAARTYVVGVGALALASVFIAASNVVFSNITQTLSPVLVAFVAFAVTGTVFGIVNRGRMPPSPGREAILCLAGLNVASAGVFVFLYVGLKHLEPAIASALQAGTTPLATIVIVAALSSAGLKSLRSVPAVEWLASGGILAGCAVLAWASFAGRSGLGQLDAGTVVIGLLAVFISGISTVFLTLFTKRLTQLGWSTLNILGHRFYVTVIATGFVWFLSEGRLHGWGELAELWPVVVLAALLGVTVPVFFLQIGIRNVAPFVVLVMTNLNPVLTYLLQMLDPRVGVSWITLTGVFCIVAGVLTVIGAKSRPGGSLPAGS